MADDRSEGFIKQPEVKTEGEIAQPASYDEPVRYGYPFFCFKHLVKGYGIEKHVDPRAAKQALAKMAMLSEHIVNSGGVQAAQLGTDKYGIKGEFLDPSKVDFKIKLPDIVSEDGKTVIHVIRFWSQNARLISLLDNETFYVLCFDVKLKAYPHGS